MRTGDQAVCTVKKSKKTTHLCYHLIVSSKKCNSAACTMHSELQKYTLSEIQWIMYLFLKQNNICNMFSTACAVTPETLVFINVYNIISQYIIYTSVQKFGFFL